jgi:hypothetical protein
VHLFRLRSSRSGRQSVLGPPLERQIIAARKFKVVSPQKTKSTVRVKSVCARVFGGLGILLAKFSLFDSSGTEIIDVPMAVLLVALVRVPRCSF